VKPEIIKSIQKVNTEGWKKISLEFGRDALEIFAPPYSVELTMGHASVLSDPQKEIEKAFSNPISSLTLEEIIQRKGKPPGEISVAITVSDITRPVPYRGEQGILVPLLKRLESSGIQKKNIKIIVGTGMHRPSTPEEKVEMYGKEVVEQYPILDHDCENNDLLVSIGKTTRGTHVYVNRYFFHSDLKIVTGLVESHFMTGISGGRKAICPGLVDVKTIERFHGPNYLEDPNANNLILEGNPCHEESLEVARTVGVDFIVNATLNKEMRMTGIFTGHLEEAHMAAFRFMKGYTAVSVDQEYDIVLTHGGYVGRNHYQTAKAACGAVPVVKQGGILIIAANNRDVEPIGGSEYKSLLHLLKLQGIERYLKIISDSVWKFTKDQWEPEVWGRVLKKVGEEGLIYCAPEISKEDYSLLPGQGGIDFLKGKRRKPSLKVVRDMVQNALLFAVYRYREKGIEPTIASIREGPYAVPYSSNVAPL
jgi:nickel-dependent lactate racemase